MHSAAGKRARMQCSYIIALSKGHDTFLMSTGSSLGRQYTQNEFGTLLDFAQIWCCKQTQQKFTSCNCMSVHLKAALPHDGAG